MSKPADKYIDLWLEQAEREQKRNPVDRVQVDLPTWIAMLKEIRYARLAQGGK